jgi:cell division protein FtsX
MMGLYEGVGMTSGFGWFGTMEAALLVLVLIAVVMFAVRAVGMRR